MESVNAVPWENLDEELHELFEEPIAYEKERALEMRVSWVRARNVPSDTERRARNRTQRLEEQRRQYAANRVAEIARVRRWQAANPEKVRELDRRRRKNERYRVRRQRWRDANRDRKRELERRWYAANRERVLAKIHARKAAKASSLDRSRNGAVNT